MVEIYCFSDLLFIGIFAICVKFALGLVSAVFRIKYNRGRNG